MTDQNRFPRRLTTLVMGAALSVLAGCAHSPTYDPQDPLEPVNRQIYRFNDTADRYVLKPVAKGYDAVTPSFVRAGVGNFFSNLAYPITVVNQFLQGKPATGTQDFGRFLVNSTFGLAGLFDPATGWGLPEHNEDFGQTFGAWGLGQGYYLMLPVLGPSTNRDLSGRIVGGPLNTAVVFDSAELSAGLTALDTIDTRAALLGADRILANSNDPYVLVRTAYLEKRRSAVFDGAPPPETEAVDFEDFDGFDE